MHAPTAFCRGLGRWLVRLGHLWARAAGKKDGLLAAQSRPSVFAQLVRQTHDYLAPVRLICACIWCTACGGDLDRRSGAQLSLVMVFSERHAPRAQDVVRGHGME